MGIRDCDRALLSCERRNDCSEAANCAEIALSCHEPREKFDWLMTELKSVAVGAAGPSGPSPKDLRLTRREREVLGALVCGNSTNKEIARHLEKIGRPAAESTVKGHVARAIRKIGASGRLQAALIVQKWGWSLT